MADRRKGLRLEIGQRPGLRPELSLALGSGRLFDEDMRALGLGDGLF